MLSTLTEVQDSSYCLQEIWWLVSKIKELWSCCPVCWFPVLLPWCLWLLTSERGLCDRQVSRVRLHLSSADPHVNSVEVFLPGDTPSDFIKHKWATKSIKGLFAASTDALSARSKRLHGKDFRETRENTQSKEELLIMNAENTALWVKSVTPSAWKGMMKNVSRRWGQINKS